MQIKVDFYFPNYSERSTRIKSPLIKRGNQVCVFHITRIRVNLSLVGDMGIHAHICLIFRASSTHMIVLSRAVSAVARYLLVFVIFLSSPSLPS